MTAASKREQAITLQAACIMFGHQSSKVPWQPARTVLPQTEQASKASSSSFPFAFYAYSIISAVAGMTAGSTHSQSLEEHCFRPTRRTGVHQQEHGTAGSDVVNALELCAIGKSMLWTGVGSATAHRNSAGSE
jgi:hypothetical protein